MSRQRDKFLDIFQLLIIMHTIQVEAVAAGTDGRLWMSCLQLEAEVQQRLEEQVVA